MSVRISTWVWQHSGAAGNDLLILLALADQADDNGLCWPSAKYIAEKTRLSRRTVQRRLAELSAEGALISVTSGRKKGGSNVYQFLVGDAVPAKGVRQSDAGVRQIDVRQDVVRQIDVRQNCDAGGVTPGDAGGTTPSDARNVNEPSGNRQGAKKRATPKRSMPEGWWPTDDMARWARTEGFAGDLRSLTKTFIDHHASKANKFADWNAAWRTWVRKEIEWSTGRRPEQAPPSSVWGQP